MDFYVSVLKENGFQDWQAKGLVELLELQDKGYLKSDSKDFKTVTGKDPRSWEKIVIDEISKAAK